MGSAAKQFENILVTSELNTNLRVRKRFGIVHGEATLTSSPHKKDTSWKNLFVRKKVPGNHQSLRKVIEEADIELKANDDEAAVARCKNQDLQAEEVLRHIDAGKWVEKLGVDFSEQLTCMLESDGSIKRIKYSDALKEENQDIPKDEKAARLDADFVLMSAELVAFADYLTEVLELNAE